MKKTIGYLIDAVNHKIEEIEIGDFHDIQTMIGCEIFTVGGQTEKGDTLYVDDEGLVNGTPYGFYWNGSLRAGNGVIEGTDEAGEVRDVQSHLQDIEASVKFFPYGDTVQDRIVYDIASEPFDSLE